MWCLLWEIPLFLPPDVFLSPGLDSVICGKIEKTTSITATFLIKTRTLDQIHTVHVPEWQHVKGVLRNVAVVVKRLQAHFPSFSAQQRIRSPCTNTHKVFRNATAALHADKLTSRDTAWLFFLHQPINNTELLLLLPCDTVGKSSLSEVWEKYWRFKDYPYDTCLHYMHLYFIHTYTHMFIAGSHAYYWEPGLNRCYIIKHLHRHTVVYHTVFATQYLFGSSLVTCNVNVYIHSISAD